MTDDERAEALERHAMTKAQELAWQNDNHSKGVCYREFQPGEKIDGRSLLVHDSEDHEVVHSKKCCNIALQRNTRVIVISLITQVILQLILFFIWSLFKYLSSHSIIVVVSFTMGMIAESLFRPKKRGQLPPAKNDESE